jgi:hypothetical protein
MALTHKQRREAEDYMKQWREDGKFTDFNHMLDEGAIAMAADRLVGAGAIDPDTCAEEVRQVSQWLVELSAEYNSDPRDDLAKLDEVFDGTTLVNCRNCGLVQFLGKFDFEMYEDELRKACWECNAPTPKVYAWGSLRRTGKCE